MSEPIKTLFVGDINYWFKRFVLVDTEVRLYIVYPNKPGSNNFNDYEYIAVEVSPKFLIEYLDVKRQPRRTLSEVFTKEAKKFKAVLNDDKIICLVDVPDGCVIDYRRVHDETFEEDDEATDDIWLDIFAKRIIKNKKSVKKEIVSQINDRENGKQRDVEERNS